MTTKDKIWTLATFLIVWWAEVLYLYYTGGFEV